MLISGAFASSEPNQGPRLRQHLRLDRPRGLLELARRALRAHGAQTPVSLARVSVLTNRSVSQSEAKTGLKAQLEAEVGACEDDDALQKLRAAFSEKERALEHKIDHEVHTFSCSIDVDYNFLR